MTYYWQQYLHFAVSPFNCFGSVFIATFLSSAGKLELIESLIDDDTAKFTSVMLSLWFCNGARSLFCFTLATNFLVAVMTSSNVIKMVKSKCIRISLFSLANINKSPSNHWNKLSVASGYAKRTILFIDSATF